MQSKVLLTMIAFVAVALAGCAADAPSGELSGGSLAASADGTFTMNANAANNPYPYSGTPLEAVLQCTPDAIAGPAGQETCSDAFTEVSATLTLSAADYMLVLNGTNEKHVGSLEADNGTYSISAIFAGEDFTGMYNEAQVRVGDLIIATASIGGGSFQIAESLAGASIDATYSGKDLEYTLSGLAAGGNYEAWLVATLESGDMEHSEKWGVSNGAGTHIAEMNVGDYSEIHVHVAGTSINVLKLTIA